MLAGISHVWTTAACVIVLPMSYMRLHMNYKWFSDEALPQGNGTQNHPSLIPTSGVSEILASGVSESVLVNVLATARSYVGTGLAIGVGNGTQSQMDVATLYLEWLVVK